MAYNINQSRGGLRNLIGNLFASGDTNAPNTPVDAATEGQVPYQYRGDPSNLVGVNDSYITPKGKIARTPFSDSRGFMARLFGAPNTAEQLNSEILGQAEMQRLLAPGKLEEAEGLENVRVKGSLKEAEGKKQLEGKYQKQDVNRAKQLKLAQDYPELSEEQIAKLSPHIQDSFIAKAKKQTAEDTTAAEKANVTRPFDVTTAQNTAAGQANESALRRTFVEDQKNTGMRTAALEAQIISPIAKLVNESSMKLAPGETEIRPGLTPGINSLFSPGVGRGSTEQMGISEMKFGDKSFPMMQKTTTPGSFRRSLTLSPEQESQLLSGGGSPSLTLPPNLPSAPSGALIGEEQRRLPGSNVMGNTSGGLFGQPEGLLGKQAQEAAALKQLLDYIRSNGIR